MNVCILWTDPSCQNRFILTVYWISWGEVRLFCLTNKKFWIQFWQLEFGFFKRPRLLWNRNRSKERRKEANKSKLQKLKKYAKIIIFFIETPNKIDYLFFLFYFINQNGGRGGGWPMYYLGFIGVRGGRILPQ